MESSLDELAQLAHTAGARVVGRLTQRMATPQQNFYLGKGKLADLNTLKNDTGAETIIFDDELNPTQQLNLEKTLKVKVIDRAALILDIFAGRAKTREGQLQVQLAQMQYLLPRLAGQWSHLERLGGGIGTRGPGETQIETDRRLIQRKIHVLKERIESVRKHRGLYREKRRKTGIPVVALVGYTNAGKSTLLNALSKANVLAENKLFATLDPTTRRIMLPDTQMVLITDTVGFIQKLPPTITTAFKATLEELAEATMLVHVVDLTSHNAALQNQTVEDILIDLGIADKPRITALNKIDQLLDSSQQWDEESALNYFAQSSPTNSKDTLFVSAGKSWGLNSLKEKLSSVLLHNKAERKVI